ncbi:ParB/RepB/Spo0J family partition protein [Lentilactobacillus laojiaonis]|uniref:ParB/RepB/Spo0J family partition protein n=1 Tax=Lentilactobacillus laojiaonis TaxID=2883998 RepID=UPI001D0A330E|nr:ParB/RepB/Spo0J family partition protein [Lentilactobacillus laojiaonis]UDM32034.1 ParB/RepB/Spo0J family partition protein [Lentilactobacillus laojiaonis]
MVNKKKLAEINPDLGPLFDSNLNLNKENVIQIKVEQIRPNPYQPRQTFKDDELNDLAASISRAGVFQPIIVRQKAATEDTYELLTGERRLRASKLANKTTIPAIVRTASEEQMMEIAILENLQREALTPLEEAKAYNMMMTKLDLTQAQVAQRLGKSRPYVANYLRILGLPPVVKQMLQDEQLSMGQARTILSVKNTKDLIKLARDTVKKSLTVRQLEKRVAELNRQTPVTKKVVEKSPFVKATEDQLQEHFGSPVAITPNDRKNGTGKIEIEFGSTDDLNRILELLDVTLN